VCEVSRDLSYRLDIARRSLASTTGPDGGVKLTRDGVIELLELLDAAGPAASELSRLQERLLTILNDPAHRTVTIPLRDVAALLQAR
jgi:hypothetical protein